MKLFLLLFFSITHSLVPDLFQLPNGDFLSSKTHQVIFADNVYMLVVQNFKPLLYSWRPGKVELRNMCEIWECSFILQISKMSPTPFSATGCKMFRNKPCMTNTEKSALVNMEDTFFTSSMAGTVQLGNRTFGYIGNKDENSIIMELDVLVRENV